MGCSTAAPPANTANNAATAAKQEKPEAKPAAATPAEDKPVAVIDGRKYNMDGKDGTAEEKAFVKEEVNKHKAEIIKQVKFDNCEDEEAAITDIAEGSFTKPGAKQKAYLYELCMPGRVFGIGGVIIAEDGKAVTHFAYGENGLSSNLYSLPDINKNGLSELFFYGGSVHQGIAGASIDLYEIKEGDLGFMGRITTYDSDEGAKDENSGSTTAYYIWAKPGKQPVFTQDVYESKGSDKWELKKKGEAVSLEGDPGKTVKIY
jgi:hypothetical protein